MNNIENLLVPNLPESINSAKIIKWHKSVGENVLENELLIEIETDKIVIEVPSPKSGILIKILKKEGSIVKNTQILAQIKVSNKNILEKKIKIKKKKRKNKNFKIIFLSPFQRRNLQKKNKKFETFLEEKEIKNKALNEKIEYKKNKILKLRKEKSYKEIEKIVPMSSLRKKIAKKLVLAQKKMAMLTTFNEVNMKHVLNLRKKYGKKFKNKYGSKLGLMPFYIKAASIALKKYTSINSSIQKNENLIFYKSIDINIAVSTIRGLVAPVIRNANFLSMLEIEKKIKHFIKQGNKGKLSIEELSEGTFTITNGGVFGSLLSTPIINPPQAAILGINVIQDRPIVVNKKIKIFPMSYLSLSYDHRIIDGKESIKFLMKVKKILENFTFELLKNKI